MIRRSLSAVVRLAVGAALIALVPLPIQLDAQTVETISIRGHQQQLRIYGSRGGLPVIVSSGDGGWIHLGPQVAQFLAGRGYFVVGFDVKAYLAAFTTRAGALDPNEEPHDYLQLATFAARGGAGRPILVGVSEGAGLSVLAAGDPATRAAIAGVIGLGLPDQNELGWRWKDSLTYLTHGSPSEPAFSTAAVIARVAPLPIAAIHSSQDEYVPLAEIQRVMEAAREPKRLWIVKASDHRFSDNVAEFTARLLDAIAWVRAHPAP